jgi:hypothetical protein
MVGDDPEDAADDGNGVEDDQPYAIQPANLNIGFNDGGPSQFDYYPDFFSHDIHQGPRLCRAYFQWNVADQAPHAGDPNDAGSRAFVDAWLHAAQGQCDEALVSFKAHQHQAAPSSAQYVTAFEKFAATNWAAETGFTGAFAFTPWNEPNNKGDDGDGLGVEIEARLAARYFLAAERSCRAHGCKVAAGDFASNGDMWNAFEWNCANDNVAPSELCHQHSDLSAGAASYLDTYKNEIVNSARDYDLPKGFRPAYFAYHGWHDTNSYLTSASHCTGYGNCAIRRILRSLGGSWASVELWDTEDGIGQKSALIDHDQACGAAFLIRLTTITSRIRRLYITRLHGGDLQLLDGHAARPALTVLAKRERTVSGCD